MCPLLEGNQCSRTQYRLCHLPFRNWQEVAFDTELLYKEMLKEIHVSVIGAKNSSMPVQDIQTFAFLEATTISSLMAQISPLVVSLMGAHVGGTYGAMPGKLFLKLNQLDC